MGDDLDLTNDGERLPPEQMIAELVESQMIFMSIGEIMQLANRQVTSQYENLSYDDLQNRHSMYFNRTIRKVN